MRKYAVISADGHMETTALDYADYIPARYVDKAPKLIRKPDGSECWLMDGFESKNEGNLYCGSRYDEFARPSGTAFHRPDGSNRPGTGDAVSRLREQDLDGLDAEVLFPPVAGPRFWRQMMQRDPAAHLEILKAYNTFLADYCSIAPDRLIGCATVPETGIDDAVAEMERCRKMGLRAVCPANWPNGGLTPEAVDDRYWAAALDLGMAVSPHMTFGGGQVAAINVGDKMAVPLHGAPVTKAMALSGAMPGHVPVFTISQLMLSGVFDRFPGLKIYFAETNAAWLPYYMMQADELYMRWYKFHDMGMAKMPSQYISEHCRFSFINDRLAMKYRYDIGLDMLMWGTDFPHSVGSYPITREVLGELFEGVPEQEKHQVLVENVCTFYGLDPHQELTPTP